MLEAPAVLFFMLPFDTIPLNNKKGPVRASDLPIIVPEEGSTRHL